MAYIDKINKNSTDYDLQDSKAARSVDGTTSSHVELTNQIYTESTQATTASFAYRTTAGDVSIETGDATIQYIDGDTVQIGHTDEVKNFQTEFASSEATATIDWDTFDARVTALVPSYTAGTTTFVYQDALATWSYTSNYGASGTISRTNLASQWGITLSGVSSEGDIINVDYTKLVIGTLTTATPTSFVATGFNQYDATAGYAHVVGGNQYRIDGTYTSLGFTTTVGGATTPVTVTNNRFTPTEDGYIYVTGGSGNILIALVWSGTMDSEPYSAYSMTTVTIPTVDASNNNLPTASYGMPSVHGVSDRLSFADKTYIQRIGHYAYSAENLAAVEAMGVDYWYDNSDIFYVLATPVTYTLADSVSGAYTANDYGTEEIIGTSVPMSVNIVYGNSLVDKLRNILPIQSIGTGLTLTGTELSAAGGGGPTVVQTRGTSETDVMSQKTSTELIYRKYGTQNEQIAIGNPSQYASAAKSIMIGFDGNCRADGARSIAIGGHSEAAGQDDITITAGSSRCYNNGSSTVILGVNAYSSYNYCVVLGEGANPTAHGQVVVGSRNGHGYNNTNYRTISGVHDGQGPHDAATVGQITPTTDSSAPTSSTAGRLGEIRIDTTDNSAYMCVVSDSATPAYEWKKITA